MENMRHFVYVVVKKVVKIQVKRKSFGWGGSWLKDDGDGKSISWFYQTKSHIYSTVYKTYCHTDPATMAQGMSNMEQFLQTP